MNFDYKSLLLNGSLWLGIGAAFTALGGGISGHVPWSVAIPAILAALGNIKLAHQNEVQAVELKANRVMLAKLSKPE